MRHGAVAVVGAALLGWVGWAGAPAAWASPRADEPPPPSPPNILIVLVDDMGIDMLASFGPGEDLPALPNMEALASQGLSFRSAWSMPVCSPTRASIMTGRLPFRTGVGDSISPGSHDLRADELTLPELVASGSGGLYATAAFGKWHLANDALAGPSAPNAAGWQHFEGFHGNLYPPHIVDPPPYDFFFFEKLTNGEPSEVHGYATIDQVDWFLTWVEAQTQPWLAYMAFNSAHEPWSAPPDGTYSVDLAQAGPPEQDPRPYYKAMLETLDGEIGRMLDGIAPWSDDTLVILLGDNGTPTPIPVAPFDAAKGKPTLYQGGVQVPLIVAGPGVATPGGECHALVNTTDLFVTVAELAGLDVDALLPPDLEHDSISFAPYLADPTLPSTRKFVYAEKFKPNGYGPYTQWDQVMRNARYKLLRRSVGSHEFFDLQEDPLELDNLLQSGLSMTEARHLRQLLKAMNALAPHHPLATDAEWSEPEGLLDER